MRRLFAVLGIAVESIDLGMLEKALQETFPRGLPAHEGGALRAEGLRAIEYRRIGSLCHFHFPRVAG
jgi:hypothetical protein